jgi:hypothetical protein
MVLNFVLGAGGKFQAVMLSAAPIHPLFHLGVGKPKTWVISTGGEEIQTGRMYSQLAAQLDQSPNRLIFNADLDVEEAKTVRIDAKKEMFAPRVIDVMEAESSVTEKCDRMFILR